MKKPSSSALLKAHSRGSFSRLVFESESNNGGGHRDRSIVFRLCQLFVISIRSITPISYVYLIGLMTNLIKPKLFGGNLFIFIVITLWMCAEALFFPYYCYLFSELNEKKSQLQHFASNKKSRMRLVKNCFQALRLSATHSSPEVHIRKALEGWFLDVPIEKIKRGNLESWCGWAFFGEDLEHLSSDEIKQNNEIVNYVEQQAAWKFPPGFQDDLPAVRLDLDPVFATQRPFLMYATVFIVNHITHAILYSLGFRKRIDCSTEEQYIYHRPGTMNKHSVDSTGTPLSPLVFVHGIGVGLCHYLAFLTMLPTEVDVYIIEWPHVAMQMTSQAPTIESSINNILKALDTDGHNKVCLSSHSLGCSLVSWMLHHPEGCRRVSATVLIDPVSFLLCDPTVATTVVYKDPVNTIDFLMHFFVARELFIANALSRHFNWSHNILFVEDLSAVDTKDTNAYCPINGNTNNGSSRMLSSLPVSEQVYSDSSDNGSVDSTDNVPHLQVRHTIILSLNDSIVPIPAVMRYLQAKSKQGHTCFETLTFEGTHGEIFLYPSWIQTIASKCRMHCGLLPKDSADNNNIHSTPRTPRTPSTPRGNSPIQQKRG